MRIAIAIASRVRVGALGEGRGKSIDTLRQHISQDTKQSRRERWQQQQSNNNHQHQEHICFMIMIEIMINERSAKIQFEYTLYGPGGTRLGATLKLELGLGVGLRLGQALLLVLVLLLLLLPVLGLSWMRPVWTGRRLCAMREINGRAKEASGERDG